MFAYLFSNEQNWVVFQVSFGYYCDLAHFDYIELVYGEHIVAILLLFFY